MTSLGNKGIGAAYDCGIDRQQDANLRAWTYCFGACGASPSSHGNIFVN
jgi:hypothetical protein